MSKERVAEAFYFMMSAHKGQVDKNGEVYALHPIRISLVFTDWRLRVIALLHDVIEDTDYAIKDLPISLKSPEIVDAIEAITHRKDEPYLKYIDRVKENTLARAVKIKDIRDNLLPSRLDDLPLGVQQRLRNKYAKALHILIIHPERGSV